MLKKKTWMFRQGLGWLRPPIKKQETVPMLLPATPILATA